MLKVTVDGNRQEIADSSGLTEKGIVFEVDNEKDNWHINQELFSGDIVKLRENHYHVIWNYKSYNIEVVDSNGSEKTFHLLINGQHIHTSVKDQFDLLLEGMGLQSKAAQKINNVKAPMPGLIQSIAVREGDHVTKGDTLLVLVAMKMENVIKSSGDGIVKTLKVKDGEVVEKNQVMLEFQ